MRSTVPMLWLFCLSAGCSTAPLVERPFKTLREIPVECAGGVRGGGLVEPKLEFEPVERQPDSAAPVDTDILLYWSDRMVAEGLLGSILPGVYGRVVATGDAEELLRSTARRTGRGQLNESSLKLNAAETGSLSLVSETSYVSGFQLDGTEGAILLDPQVDTVREGCHLLVTVNRETDARQYDLDVRLESASLQRPIAVSSTEVLGSQPLSVQTPLFFHLSLSGAAGIAAGESLLLAGPDPNGMQRYLLALITPR